MKIQQSPVSLNRIRYLTCFILTSLLALGALQAEPKVPYFSYTYNEWDESVPAAQAYEPEKVINGYSLGIGSLATPKDMSYQGDKLYVLDSGNKRVIVLDKDLNFIRQIDTFMDGNMPVEFTDLQGIYVDHKQRIILADAGNKAVYIADLSGNIQAVINKPTSDLFPGSVDFLPQKVLVDKNNTLFVLASGIYQGAVTFDQNNEFSGFFGSNKVSVTDQLLTDRIWRNFQTAEQRKKQIRYIPVEYVNFALGPDNFIYTVSNFPDNMQRGHVKKINSLSQNILYWGSKPDLQYFGDLESVWTGRTEQTRFAAIDVDQDEFINVLDLERGRIFQYDQNCDLVNIFGGKSNQQGTFQAPSAIKTIGDKIVVLDDTKASLTMFKLTDFGKAVRQGTILYNKGLYNEALNYWQIALKYDNFSVLALRGVGRAYERLDEYTTAMEYFKKANYHGSYSRAYQMERANVLRDNFALIALAIILVILIPFAVSYFRRKNRKTGDRLSFLNKWQYPFYLVLHPFKGWEEFRREKQGSLMIANIILLLWAITIVAEYQFTGFIFNPNRLELMNIILLLGPNILGFVFMVVSNWAISTLNDGKGKFRNIWIFGSYALLSGIIIEIPFIILSNILTGTEGFFLGLLSTVSILWAFVQFTAAIKAVHQYSLKQTIISMILTVIGVLLIIIVIVLFYSLFMQVFGFGQTLVQELMLRS